MLLRSAARRVFGGSARLASGGKGPPRGRERVTEFAVDRSGLVDYSAPARPSPESLAAKEELTPLAADLRSLIQLRGPLSVLPA